jgi:hypothetical protein
VRTKRVLNTLKKEKAKLDREAEQIGRAISVLEGRAPGRKRYRHSQQARARIAKSKRLWWARRQSLLKSAQSQNESQNHRIAPGPPDNTEHYRLKPFKTIQAGTY